MSQDLLSITTPEKESLNRADPEVKDKPERRRFTTEYNLRILEEADNCTGPGQIGAILRREWVYSSNLTRNYSRGFGVQEWKHFRPHQIDQSLKHSIPFDL